MGEVIQLNTNGGSSQAAGGGSNISGIGSNTQLNINDIPPVYAYSNLFEQIAGFNPMYPCDYFDCRDNSICGYLSPVFGLPGATVQSYENDESTFTVNCPSWLPAAQFLIQKQNQQWFGAKSNLGQWTTVATITDNTYGDYNPVGAVPFNPTYTKFRVNWGLVVAAFGNGIYRITADNCTPLGGSQASVIVTIPNSWAGTVISGNIGITGSNPINLPFVWNTDDTQYTLFLAYLAALINSTGLYTVVPTGSGLTITGINYQLSNGNTVFFHINDSSNICSVYDSNVPTGVTANGYASEIKNPEIFNRVNYNQGGYYNTATGLYTAPVNGSYTFSGVVFAGMSADNGFPNGVVTISLLVDNTPVLAMSFSSMTNIIANIPYSFTHTINAGHTVSIKIGIVTGGVSGVSYTSTLVSANMASIYNVPPTIINLDPDTLTGGTEPTPNCGCMMASQPFLLRAWNCELARGTVKFETVIGGTIGDAFNDGNLFVFNGWTMYDSIRVPGWFGKEKSTIEEVINEYGVSGTQPIGYEEKTRGKDIPNNTFYSKEIPFWVYKGLLRYGLMPGGMQGSNVLVSDYNSNNANLFLKQKQQKLKGTVKTKYMNKGHFPKGLDWMNRQMIIEFEMEDGIQSGLASSVNV